MDGVLWAHRTSPKTATGEEPFTLVYGSNAVIPAEVRLASHRVLHYDPIQNDELRRLDLDFVDMNRDAAVLRAAKYKSIVKAGFDKKVVVRKFSKGDLVLKRADALHPAKKFDPTWEGPFVVTEVLGGGAYHLADSEGRPLTRPWNINTLKKIDKAFKLYDTVILPMTSNDDEPLLKAIDNKKNITLFANAGCAYTCPSKICYPSVSMANKTGDHSLFACSQKLKERNTIGMYDFDLDYLQSLGFERFKLLRPRQGDMTGF